MLNDEKLCDMFYKEYRAEHSETEILYKRYQFAVAAIALIAGVVGAVTRRDLLSGYWTRVDVFLYYTSVGLAGLCLLSASVCLVVSIKPRKFQHLDDLEKWWKWRMEYRKEVVESGFGKDDPTLVDVAVATATCNQAIERLAEAADWNAAQNRTKLRWFNYGFYFTVAAIGAVAFQALMHAIVFLNQVKVP
ncbi:MAG: hypothetical protein SFZ23_13050 [Planctomycetota bacterium]|nr:hypothetical protein [Planctomycetota bacterium]